MNYLRNHCWCSSSNWGGNYDCQIIVSLQSYDEAYKEDWENLIIKTTIKEKLQIADFTEIEIDREILRLKPEVLLWLHENVLDFQRQPGWCVGSDSYNKDSAIEYSVFFQRRKDAMKFIKTWSKWKKPLFYCQYFTDIRKELNITTGKYISYS